MRQSWTDDRLDDLNGKVDAFRLETRTEFSAIPSEMKEGFERVDGEFKELRGEFKELRGEVKEVAKELGGEIADVEARLRTQASEYRADTSEDTWRFASLQPAGSGNVS